MLRADLLGDPLGGAKYVVPPEIEPRTLCLANCYTVEPLKQSPSSWRPGWWPLQSSSLPTELSKV